MRQTTLVLAGLTVIAVAVLLLNKCRGRNEPFVAGCDLAYVVDPGKQNGRVFCKSRYGVEPSTGIIRLDPLRTPDGVRLQAGPYKNLAV